MNTMFSVVLYSSFQNMCAILSLFPFFGEHTEAPTNIQTNI